jgi:hypothetical protein
MLLTRGKGREHLSTMHVFSLGIRHEKEREMSIKGQAKEAAGFVKEEAYEHGKSSESKKKAQEGRDLRNQGRIEDGKEPKTTKPGTGH